MILTGVRKLWREELKSNYTIKIIGQFQSDAMDLRFIKIKFDRVRNTQNESDHGTIYFDLVEL